MKTNLNLLKDGNHYDAELREKTDDISFYVDFAGYTEAKQILELGIGTARVSLRLAENGHSITGIDDSESMLNLARTKLSNTRGNARLIKDDIRNIDFDRKFDLVICPFNTLMHFDFDELEGLLRKVHRALKTCGHFIIDVTNPELFNDAQTQPPPYSSSYSDPFSGAAIHIKSARRVKNEKVEITRSFVNSSQELISEETISMYRFPVEDWVRLVNDSGFNVLARYGNFEGSDFNHQSYRLIMVCLAQR